MAHTTQRRYDTEFPELDYTWQGNKLVATDENGFRDFAYVDNKIFTDEGKKLALMGLNRAYLQWLHVRDIMPKEIYHQCKVCKEVKNAKDYGLLDMGNRNLTCMVCYAKIKKIEQREKELRKKELKRGLK